MKKRFLWPVMAGFVIGAVSLAGCGTTGSGAGGSDSDSVAVTMECQDIPMRELTVQEGNFHHTYLVADVEDHANIYQDQVDRSRTMVVISKKEYRLYVYEMAEDTTLVASFPVCYAINPGPKQGEGDNSTPECGMNNPFTIMEMNDASTWCFDFGDGRGSDLAFGDWFLRLDLSNSFPDNPELAGNRSIGIHGSTGNERSVPGRDSHGCVRMLDQDLVTLHDRYVQIGTRVIIKGINEDKLPFEVAAQQRLGDRYVAQKPGNPLLK